MAIDVNYEFDISKWPTPKISAKDILGMYGPLYGVQPVIPKWTGLPYYTEPTKPQSVDQQIKNALAWFLPTGIVASNATLDSPTYLNLLAAVPELKELPITVDERIFEGELRINFGTLTSTTYRVYTLYAPTGGNAWSK